MRRLFHHVYPPGRHERWQLKSVLYSVVRFDSHSEPSLTRDAADALLKAEPTLVASLPGHRVAPDEMPHGFAPPRAEVTYSPLLLHKLLDRHVLERYRFVGRSTTR